MQINLLSRALIKGKKNINFFKHLVGIVVSFIVIFE